MPGFSSPIGFMLTNAFAGHAKLLADLLPVGNDAKMRAQDRLLTGPHLTERQSACVDSNGEAHGGHNG